MNQSIITDEFLTELLDVLESINEKATTEAEKELMFRVLSVVNDNVEFTNNI